MQTFGFEFRGDATASHNSSVSICVKQALSTLWEDDTGCPPLTLHQHGGAWRKVSGLNQVSRGCDGLSCSRGDASPTLGCLRCQLESAPINSSPSDYCIKFISSSNSASTLDRGSLGGWGRGGVRSGPHWAVVYRIYLPVSLSISHQYVRGNHSKTKKLTSSSRKKLP